MKKTLALLASLLLVLAVLPAQATQEKATTTVTIWHSAQGPNADVFEEIAETFNTTIGKDKGIVIEAIYQGKANDVLTKVNAATGTDTLPDIAMMDATAALDMNSSAYLVPVTKLGVDTSSILPCAISSYSSEKGLLGLPFNASALLYYYNKTLYDSLGLAAPKTIADMKANAEVIGKSGKTAFSGVPATFEISTFIGAQNGGTYLVNNRNGHDGAATEVLFGKEGTYKAFLEAWKSLYETGAYDPISSGVTGEFTSGRTASMLASSSNLAAIIASVGDEFEVAVAKVPVVNEKADGGTVISGGALFSFTQSEAVKTVLEYLITEDVQVKWSEATGYVPVNTKAYETAEYKAFLREKPQYTVALDSLLQSSPKLANVWLPSAYSIYYSFQANVVDAVKGNMTIDQAVDAMVKTVEDAIAVYSVQN